MANWETRQAATEPSSPPSVSHVHSRFFSDPEELAEGIPEVDGEFVQVSRGAFEARVTRVELAQVTLQQTYSLPETVSEMAIDDSTLVLGTSLQCDGPLVVYGKVLEPRKLFIPDGEFVRRATNFRGTWIGLNREEIESTVCALLGVDEIRLPGGFLPGHEGLEHSLVAAIADYANATVEHPERFADPSARDTANYALLSRALELLVAVCESARATEPPPADKARIVRRANEFFDAAGPESVSLADLAKAARVSARSLNYAFQDLYDLSPMRYFSLKRLGRARSELRRSSSEPGAVKRVALGVGRTHLGRFASEYRALFGELPSVTLTGRGSGETRA
jgi:AraC family ethanolamine operon transcriptional activator